LDTDCKEALQQLLKPGNLGMIVPWMKTASPQEKRDVVTLGRIVREADSHLQTPAKAWAASQEQVVTNRQGRARLANTVPVSADRAQQDLLRNRHGQDKKDPEIQRRRDFFQSFAPVPTVGSVSDFYAMAMGGPIVNDPAMNVLDGKVRRKLDMWQVRGPEKEKEAAARAVRSLRSVSSAVNSLPTYSEHTANHIAMNSKPGKNTLSGQAHLNCLYEYSKAVPKDHDKRVLLSAGSQQELHLQRQILQNSSSAPALPRRLTGDELCVGQIGYFEGAELQMRKIRERSVRSKIPNSGGAGNWATTYGTLMESGLVES
jgi:hypothetical protein